MIQSPGWWGGNWQGPYIRRSDLDSSQHLSASRCRVWYPWAYLGGDQGRQTSANDVTHLVRTGRVSTQTESQAQCEHKDTRDNIPGVTESRGQRTRIARGKSRSEDKRRLRLPAALNSLWFCRIPPPHTSFLPASVFPLSLHDLPLAIMSLFRVSRAAYLRPSRLAAPVNTRFISSNDHPRDPSVKTSPTDAPTTPHQRSDLINKETPSEAMARHQPDYNATVDHGTSYVLSCHRWTCTDEPQTILPRA